MISVIGFRCLRRLVELCQSFLREIDILARFGGEEFMILLPKTNAKNTCVVANRLRVLLEKDTIDAKVKQTCYTVSIGVTEVQIDGDNIESLIKCADLALYRTKRVGRNQVCYNGR